RIVDGERAYHVRYPDAAQCRLDAAALPLRHAYRGDRARAQQRGGGGQPARAPSAWMQPIVQPQIHTRVGIMLPHEWQRARIAVDDDMRDAAEALRPAIALPVLGAVMLYHPRAERIRNAHQRRFGAPQCLHLQRTRVVWLLAHGVVEQDRTHLSVYC